MASHITHYYYGRRVKQELDTKLRMEISRYQHYYDIGNQGPDLFFYAYNNFLRFREEPVGASVHRHSFSDFFNRNRKLLSKTKRPSKEWSYFYGVLCHFLLDLSIHKIIYSIEDDYEISHIAMERELDRFILEEEGFNPYTFHTKDVLPVEKGMPEVIAPFYDSYTRGDIALYIRQGLSTMRTLEDRAVLGREKSRSIRKIVLGTGPLKPLQGKILTTEIPKEANETTPILHSAFEEARANAGRILPEVDLFLETGHYPEEFSHDFLGNKKTVDLL